MKHLIEIHLHNLKPTMREEFRWLYIAEALPLLQRWDFNGVTHDQSISNKNPTDAWG